MRSLARASMSRAAFLRLMLGAATAFGSRVRAAASDDVLSFGWPNEVPADCPFPRSDFIKRVRFTGRHAEYTNADTWYPTWGADGHLYSSWTDGYFAGADITGGRIESTGWLPFAGTGPSSSDYPGYPCNSTDFRGRKAATAQARIEGDDPLRLRVINLPPRVEASAGPYNARYPAGTLRHRENWYYGTYCVNSKGNSPGIGWETAGPFVGFRISRDLGRTWSETPHTPEAPIFGEDPARAPVRIAIPHFVDFGRDLEHSPDGKAYLLSHGSRRPNARNNWIQGDEIVCLRVTPTPEAINDPAAYEFFAGWDARGRGLWSPRLADMQPLLRWDEHLGNVAATYVASLKRYFMWITRGVRNNPRERTQGDFHTLLLEAPAITGPWRLACYWRRFGPIAYFVNLPSKFIAGDGLTAWLCYSANWDFAHLGEPGVPVGSRYAMCLHELRLTV